MEELNLIELTEKITQKIIREVTEAYHANQINEILKKYGLDEEIQYSYYDINRAKILVIGNSRVNKNDLYGIAKSLGIRRDILEFELDYIRIHNFDFNNLRNYNSHKCNTFVNVEGSYTWLKAKMDRDNFKILREPKPFKKHITHLTDDVAIDSIYSNPLSHRFVEVTPNPSYELKYFGNVEGITLSY